MSNIMLNDASATPLNELTLGPPIKPPPPPVTEFSFVAGMVVKGTGPAVYLVDFINNAVQLRWVPNPATANALFVNWGQKDAPDEALAWAVRNHGGPAIPSGSCLIRGENTAPVYFLDGNTARWMTSPEVFNQYHFNWQQVRVVPFAVINALQPQAANNVYAGHQMIVWYNPRRVPEPTA